MTSPKHLLYKHFATVGKALAHPSRLEILDLLGQGEKPVETLAEQTRMGIKNTSAHLRVLREAALVDSRREGTRIYYRLAEPVVHDLFAAVQDVGRRRIAAVREIIRDYFTAPAGLEAVALDELRERIEQGAVTLLDVRPEDEYAQGHIRGAVSIPLSKLSARLAELPRDREIVAYCRGPYCVLAVEAAALLRREGFRARRLADGMPAWTRAGFPIEPMTTR